MKKRDNGSSGTDEEKKGTGMIPGREDDIRQVLVEHQSRIVNEINTNINENDRGNSDED